MEAPLGEPHVEVGVEAVEGVLLVLELDGVPASRKATRRSSGEVEDLRPVGDDPGGEVEDVGALVAVLGDRPAEAAASMDAPKKVHLVAAVVDVELHVTSAPAACRTRAMASPRTAHRVCPRCNGPVRLAEMNSTFTRWPASTSEPPCRRTGGENVRRNLSLRARVDGDVEEPGAGDLHRGHALGRLEPPLQLCEGPRVGATFFASCIATLVA